jgi:TnpA family transposase
MLRKLAA